MKITWYFRGQTQVDSGVGGGWGGRILKSSLASLLKKPLILFLEPYVAALLFCGQVTFFLLFVYSFPTNPVSPCYRCEAPNSQCTPVMYEVSLRLAVYRWLVITHVVLVYIDQVALHWRWIFEEYWSNIYLIRLNYMQIIIIVIIVINIFIIVFIIIVVVMTTK